MKQEYIVGYVKSHVTRFLVAASIFVNIGSTQEPAYVVSCSITKSSGIYS